MTQHSMKISRLVLDAGAVSARGSPESSSLTLGLTGCQLAVTESARALAGTTEAT